MSRTTRAAALMLSLATLTSTIAAIVLASPASALGCPAGYHWDADLLECAPNPPDGGLDTPQRQPNGIRVTGWARDPSSTGDAVEVDVMVDGVDVLATTANMYRNNVGYHGFDVIVAAPAPAGSHTLCAVAYNSLGDGASIGCRSFTVRFDPYGWLDNAVQAGANSVRVAGWAIDPDTATSIDIHVYVDNSFATAVTANGSRPDVGAAFPGYGDAHGYDTVVSAGPGQHNVCTYGINVGYPGVNALITCATVVVNMPPVAPFGLSATPTDRSVLVVWNQDSSNPVDWARLERSTAGGPWDVVADPVPSSSGGGSKSYTDGGRTPNTSYCYRVFDRNAYGTSPASAVVCTTTLLARPSAPTNMSVTASTSSSLTLSWYDNANDEDRYQVSRSGASQVIGAHLGTGPMSFTTTGLSPSTSYCFDVWAEKTGAQPSDKAHACGSTNAAAPTISAFTASPSSVQLCETRSIALSWSVSGASRLTVFRGTEATPILDTSTPLPSSFTDPLPQKGGVTYKLVAYGTDGLTTTTRTTSVVQGNSYPLAKSLTVKNNTAPAGATTGELIRVQQYDQSTGALLADRYVAVGNSVTFTLPDCLYTYVRVHRMSSGADYLSTTYLGSATGNAATETI